MEREKINDERISNKMPAPNKRFGAIGAVARPNFVQIWKLCARPNDSESPACVKPLGRYGQCRTAQWRIEI